MTIYTIGFAKKSAKQFFEILKYNDIDLLLDIRLNNKSQLAGFTKGKDLEYFLSEICKCEYLHCVEFAPTKEILDAYKKRLITWDEYVIQYEVLINTRDELSGFTKRFSGFQRICLLCSEPTPEHCHRRLLADMIVEASRQAIEIIHI